MLLNSTWMFRTDEELHNAKWSMNNLDCSIESIRFITETVTYYMEKRLFPDQLIDHRYFQVDVTQLPTVRSKLSEI